MNDALGPTPAVAYDAAELRRRIAVCFSVSELRQLAESLGVSATVTWDRGSQEAVRDLVKQFERYYGLETLVAKLRELRPLVEWPEPLFAPAPTSASAPAPISLPVPLPPPVPPPVSASAPASASVSASAPAPALSPFAAPPLRSPGTLGTPAPPASEPPDAGPILQDPMVPPSTASAPRGAAPYWPGLSSAPPEPSRSKGIDPRVLIAVAGLTVLAALIAYLAGRASNPPKEATDDAAPAGSAKPSAKRADGPATRVAAALTRTLAAVGRVCEVPAKTPKDAEIFARSFEQCGPAPRPTVTATPKTPPADAPSQPAGRPAPRGGNAGAKDTPKAPGNPCLTACEGTFRGCTNGCGAEPTQASQNEAYMNCRSRCMIAQSRCNRSCPQ